MLRSICLAFLLCPIALASEQDSNQQRPNIVLIMADDLGFSDLGCYGSEIETPNLDQLASQGLRLNQFYNTAKCHSSRICLLTGLYMFQAGNNKMDKGVTIAEVLANAGYRTMMSGKWHLEAEPTDRGFQRYFGHLSGATNFFHGDNTFRLNGTPFEVPKEDFYTTDQITDFANAEYPTEFEGRPITPLQGKSLVPVFDGEARPGHDWLYFQFSNNRAIRVGDDKLVSVKGRPWELYNLATDRSELNNLVKQAPQKAKDLKALWHEVAETVEKAPEKLRKPVGAKGSKAKNQKNK